MVFALTVDQIGSRRRTDRIDATIERLAGAATLLPFVRTVGDEFQGLLGDPLSVLDAILLLMRSQGWHIGLGIGGVEQPLPADSRSARGDALLSARTAVEQAKAEPSHLAVRAARAPNSEDADVEAVLRLLGGLYARRTRPGWEVVDLARQGLTHSEAADRLGVTRQAVGQRLRAAQWEAEEAVRPALARLLERADRAAAG